MTSEAETETETAWLVSSRGYDLEVTAYTALFTNELDALRLVNEHEGLVAIPVRLNEFLREQWREATE